MPDMKDIYECVICGRRLRPNRTQVDTCEGSRCRQALLAHQRALLALDAEIERQKAIHGPNLHQLLAVAAQAAEEINPDELERFAAGVQS